jgi:hypothetical protein
MKLQHGLVACACLGVVVYLVHDARSRRAEIDGLRAQLAAVASAPAPTVTVREVTRELVPVPAPHDEEPAAAAAAAPGANAEAKGAAPSPPRMEPAEQRARYSSKFNEEPRDAQWASASQATATAKLTAVLPPSSELTSVECRSSMCKIETVHEDVERYHEFAKGAFMDPKTVPWNGAFFSTGSVDPATGKFVAVAYLVREGEPMPQL